MKLQLQHPQSSFALHHATVRTAQQKHHDQGSRRTNMSALVLWYFAHKAATALHQPALLVVPCSYETQILKMISNHSSSSLSLVLSSAPHTHLVTTCSCCAYCTVLQRCCAAFSAVTCHTKLHAYIMLHPLPPTALSCHNAAGRCCGAAAINLCTY